MADGGNSRAPFDAALQLTAWALTHFDYLEGRLLLAGVDVTKLSARQWLSATYVLIADSVDGMVDREMVHEKLNAALASPAIVTRQNWGTGPSAEAGQRAMMDLTDGPAPMRDPDKKPPAAVLAARAAREAGTL